MSTPRAIAALVLAGLLCGCGSFQSLDASFSSRQEPSPVYGGVRFDWAMLTEDVPHADGVELGMMRAFGLLDLPLSLVADTVLIPVTLLVHANWEPPADETPELSPAK